MKKIKWFLSCVLCFTCINQIHGESHVITNIPVGGIHIDSSGSYVLNSDLTWQPAADGQAILITANNVVLDLHGHSITSDTSTFQTIGIKAASSANVTIQNGTIANMSLGGIKCEASANIYINHIVVDGLTLENVVTYTVPVGILADLCIGVKVDECTVKNLDVRTGSLAGIQMTATLESEVTNCRVKNLLNRDGACTGIGHLLCDIAEVKGCVLDGLVSEFIDNLNTEGHTAIGIIPVLSTNLKIKDCVVANVTGCCDDAHGISVFECLNAKVKKCHVENVLDGAGEAQTGAKATGIEIYASGVKVKDCFVKNITAINPQDLQATGFSCAQCEDVKFFNCTAENVNVVDEEGNHDASLGYGTGFGWAPDPRIIVPANNVLYSHCTAKHCQVGFDSWFHINSRWNHIHSHCNGISILDLNHSERTLMCNPCSECGCLMVGCYPTPLVITIENVAENNVFLDVHATYCQN